MHDINVKLFTEAPQLKPHKPNSLSKGLHLVSLVKLGSSRTLFFLYLLILIQTSSQLRDGLWHVRRFQSQSALGSKTLISHHHTITHVIQGVGGQGVRRISNPTKTMWRAFIWLLFNCRNSQALHRSSRTSSPESKPNELQRAILFFFLRVCLWQWSSFSSCPSRTWNISRKTTPQQSQMLTDMQHLHLIPCYLLFERAERCSFPQMTMSRLKDSVELCSTKWYSPILTPMVMWEIYLFTQQER